MCEILACVSFVIFILIFFVDFVLQGQQIGQQEKENIFLDCFTAFWEISGCNLLQDNELFTARIRADLKRKVLNENIARCV